MDTGLGIGVTLHAHGFARAFACTRVGLRALSAYRQSAHVADTPITFNTLQTLEIHADFAAQIAFNDVFAFLDRMDNLGKLLLGKVFGADGRVNVSALEDFLRVDG